MDMACVTHVSCTPTPNASLIASLSSTIGDILSLLCRAWQDGSGSLDRAEIVRALIKTIPGFNGNNEEMLEVSFSNIWCVIDLNNDGETTQRVSHSFILF